MVFPEQTEHTWGEGTNQFHCCLPGHLPKHYYQCRPQDWKGSKMESPQRVARISPAQLWRCEHAKGGEHPPHTEKPQTLPWSPLSNWQQAHWQTPCCKTTTARVLLKIPLWFWGLLLLAQGALLLLQQEVSRETGGNPHWVSNPQTQGSWPQPATKCNVLVKSSWVLGLT